VRSLQDEIIDFGPVKIFTVKSGGVRVCYDKGKVRIYPEGRYGIFSPTFVIAGYINTQLQNLRFEQHKVLLDGGISLFVEGLLTFQVIDVEKLITQLGETDLLHAVKDVSKAELARVFASIHLEQISSAVLSTNDSDSLLGKAQQQDPADEHDIVEESYEGAVRNQICRDVLNAIKPIMNMWGVLAINFQLESTSIADEKYAGEYEEASLSLAKAKANRRAIDVDNEIQLRKAHATASALKIEALGKKEALLIEASAKAEAARLEAAGRNDAAKAMHDPFARKYALAGQQVDFARNLKADVLTVLPAMGAFAQDGPQRNQMQ